MKHDYFYLRPLTKFENVEDSVWYVQVPVGRNKLSKITASMCSKAGIGGNKTNHSLRATGATELYMAGVPEKIIQERTGHKSTEALRMYEKKKKKQLKTTPCCI